MNNCSRWAWIPVLCAALAGCETPAPVDIVKVNVQARSGLYKFGAQRLMVLRGSPYQMGQDHGRLMAGAVRTMVRESLAWTYKQGMSREQLLALSDLCWPYLPQDYKDEMRGLAEGSGAMFNDIRILHAMPSKFHCSGAAAAGAATADGKLYHTRSLDYSLDIGEEERLQNHALVIVRQPAEGLANAVVSWAGFLGAVTGMNTAGISIGEMGSASRNEDYAGIPMIFMVREALRTSRNLQQALDVFRLGPRTCGFNFIIGSGDEGLAVALEVTRDHFFVSGFGDAAENVGPHRAMPEMVRRTNHFVGEKTAGTQRRMGEGYHPDTYMVDSWERYQEISVYLEAMRGKLDARTMIDLLRKYPSGHPCLHQAVMCGTDRKMWVSQAVDDRKSSTPGAQNQQFYEYDLLKILRL